MLKELLFSALLLGTSFGAAAQINFRPGYVVQLNGDTLRGEIESRSELRNTVLCQFRPAAGENVVEYAPPEIRGYSITGVRRYQSQMLPNAASTPVFMRVIATGTLSVYHLLNQQNKEAYYSLKKSDGILRELIQRDTILVQYNQERKSESKVQTRVYPFRNVLWELMADCPSVQSRLTQIELAESQLSKVVTAYNACVGGAQYVAAARKNNVKLAALAGAYQAKVTYKQDGEREMTSAATPTFGLGIEIQPNKLNEHLSVLLQALYTKTKYQTEYQGVGSLGPGYDKTANISVTAIHLPLLLRYSLTRGVVRPYVQAGGIFALNIQREGQQTDRLARISTKPTVQPIDLRSYGIGGTLGIGFTVPTAKAGGFILEARVNSFDSTSEVIELVSGARSLSLLAGYTFGK